MKQVGTFPTPYGLTVPVYEANDPRDPEAVTFTAEGVALVGGIYPPDRRRAFIQFCKETGRVDIDAVHRFGGGAPPRMTLRQIDCIEAAAVYALSAHSQWRDAGLAWLEPFRTTWFRDWLGEHPAYRRWAAASIGQNSALPGWLAGGVQ